MRLLTTLLLLFSCTATLFAQKFIPVSGDKQLLDVKEISTRKNTVVFGNNVYYTTPNVVGGGSNLAVVGLGGSNPKILTNIPMNGSNYLAATKQFIYFNSYSASIKYYQLFRYNPTTDKVEMIVSERDGKPMPFCGDNVAMSQMYVEGDKLVFAGTFRASGNADFRSLALVEDEKHMTYILYTDKIPNTRNYRRLELMFEPAFNDIAVTDSSVYVYS